MRPFLPLSLSSPQLWQAFIDYEIDAAAVSELVTLLKHEDPELRISAGWALTNRGGQAYRSDIEALQQDKDNDVRDAAAEMIEELNAPLD